MKISSYRFDFICSLTHLFFIFLFFIFYAVCSAGNNTVYEIFVRSFYDGQGSDGIGDFAGLTQKLDYLNDNNPNTDDDLEVGILWLMPIFQSPSYHGYDVTDYYQPDTEYGTLQDFDQFIKAATLRHIRVILDIPFNHTSNQHPWFKDAVEKPFTSPYRNYYYLSVDKEPTGEKWHWLINQAGQKVYYFGDFGANMPDLNLNEPDVKAEVKKIARYWLDRGVAGFRLDAAKHIFAWSGNLSWEEIQKNNAWWKEFSDSVYQANSSAILVGEVLDSPQVIHHLAWGLDNLLDFPFMQKMRDFYASPYDGMLGWWKDYLVNDRENNTKFNTFVYVSSHDENPRLASFLEKNAPQRVEPTYRMAMCLMMTLSKYPILYYGDEIMQKGWKWNGGNPPGGDGSGIYDETLREPFEWYKGGTGQGQTNWFKSRYIIPNDGISVEEQKSTSNSMLSLVKGLTHFRALHPDFADEEIGNILNDSKDWLIFEKTAGGAAYLILINFSAMGQDYRFHDQWHPEYKNAKLLFWADGSSGRWEDVSGLNKTIADRVYVAAYGVVILKK